MEYMSGLYLLFVDFQKAFDSVDRSKMWSIIGRYGISPKIIDLIKGKCDGYTCQIVYEKKISDPIEVKTDVRQGCISSSTFFFDDDR